MSGSGRRLRTSFALLIAAVMLVQSVGVARAMSIGKVHCCCGVHSVARLCACLRCPMKLKRAVHHDDDHGTETVRPLGACSQTSEDGALIVLATLAAPPALSPSAPVAYALMQLEQDPPGEDSSTPRPPP